MADHSQTADELAQVVQARSLRPEPRDSCPPAVVDEADATDFQTPRLMHYNRLILLVMALNAVVAWYGVSSQWWCNKGATSPRLQVA